MNHGGPPQFPRVGVHRHSILINMTDRSCKRMQMNLRKASATLTPLGAGCIANLGWNRSQKKQNREPAERNVTIRTLNGADI